MLIQQDKIIFTQKDGSLITINPRDISYMRVRGRTKIRIRIIVEGNIYDAYTTVANSDEQYALIKKLRNTLDGNDFEMDTRGHIKIINLREVIAVYLYTNSTNTEDEIYGIRCKFADGHEIVDKYIGKKYGYPEFKVVGNKLLNKLTDIKKSNFIMLEDDIDRPVIFSSDIMLTETSVVDGNITHKYRIRGGYIFTKHENHAK